VKVVADAEAVALLAAETVAAAIRDGTRSLVLTGGTTPRRMYGLLAGM
jgi:6-phosphogluconolactonase/glucosamine-6-phosphate isomerase/deaminase